MLRVMNLTCGYARRMILWDISFAVDNGEFIGIIGPNGSGKTTLLRAISRVISPQSGSVLLENRDIRYLGFKELAGMMAVVPQGFNGSVMTVEEFVLLGRIPHHSRLQFLETGKDLEIAERCMVLTGTLELKERFMEELSGGERQLVLIARALAQEPKLLLLDEPTAHLDIAHQVRILDLVKKLNRELGLTVIVVLHDLNLASEYCGKLLLVNRGRIHQAGHPRDVLSYRTIEEVYQTVVVVRENPFSGKPYILAVSAEERKGRGRDKPGP
ncbi:MAG: ABC transporter ATP-binding protein [Candidatus Omnitrophota bacterium]